jgi:DNA-binding NtrC family response regulator
MIKILIIEDEILIAEALMMDLREKGLNVCEYATEAEKAISKIKENSPDMILMDIHLSDEIDGIEIARIALEQNPKVKIIFITGYNVRSFADRLENVKFFRLMEKPVMINQIVEIVRKIEDNSRDKKS